MAISVHEEKISDVWQKVLDEISTKLSTVTFDVWIKTLKPVELKGNTLVVSSPSLTSKNLVDKNYVHMLKEILTKKHSGILDLEIIVEDEDNFEEEPGQELTRVKNTVAEKNN